MIVATHYLQTLEQHFEDVVSGGGQGTPDRANKSVHICVQSKAAASSSDSHEVQQRSQQHVIVRNDANRRDPRQTVIVGDKGLEPLTPSV